MGFEPWERLSLEASLLRRPKGVLNKTQPLSHLSELLMYRWVPIFPGLKSQLLLLRLCDVRQLP